MIIWSGWGFLVAVFVFASALLCNVLFDELFGEGYYAAHRWTIGVALIAAAIPSAGLAMLVRRRPQSVADAPPAPAAVHSLFFIPVKYWALLLVALGLVLCLLQIGQ